ncbi:MAG: hypothetical protein ACKVWV_12960 [Planctomycetota bacterium]
MIHQVLTAVCRCLELALIVIVFACSMWLTCIAFWMPRHWR